jgi:hypothetical protein
MALARAAGAQTLDFKAEDIYDRIHKLTHGRGRMRGIKTSSTPSAIPSSRRNGFWKD